MAVKRNARALIKMFFLDPPYCLPKKQLAYLIKEMITNVRISCSFYLSSYNS